MFNELSEKLDSVFRSIRGQGKLTEKNIRDALRDIRRALLEADVNFKVAKRFIAHVQDKALGSDVLDSITPGQMIVKIVHDELVSLLGSKAVPFKVNRPDDSIMVCGLQGSGKTTSVIKLAKLLNKTGNHVAVASVDIHRPAAIDQLRVLADKNDVRFIGSELRDPVAITKNAVEQAKAAGEVLILDTAGRLHIDDEMMRELSAVRQALEPGHILFVADGMTGQDAVNAVEGFSSSIEFDGVILTKLDSDARGGAALSIRDVTGKPILFVGTGEKSDALEVFHPERYASRILGMGDIVSLVERAQDVVDEKKARQLHERMRTEGLTLEDFLEQLQQIQNMGPLDQLLGMIPGVGKAMKGLSVKGDELKHVEAIILSMTRDERRKPNIINGSRRKRIAAGSGTTVQDVNNLLKQYAMMQKMMKKMSHLGRGMKGMPGMPFPQ